jgi:hypothetical protein
MSQKRTWGIEMGPRVGPRRSADELSTKSVRVCGEQFRPTALSATTLFPSGGVLDRLALSAAPRNLVRAAIVQMELDAHQHASILLRTMPNGHSKGTRRARIRSERPFPALLTFGWSAHWVRPLGAIDPLRTPMGTATEAA